MVALTTTATPALPNLRRWADLTTALLSAAFCVSSTAALDDCGVRRTAQGRYRAGGEQRQRASTAR
jgi:hypothetical protein